MKILLLGSKEYPFGSSYKYDKKAGGGIEVHVEKLSKYLAREGHEVFIITRKFPGQKKQETKKTGKSKIHVYRTKFMYNKFLRTFTFNALSSKEANRIIKENKIDIIHCHGPVAGFFGSRLSKKTKIPMVFTTHGPGKIIGWNIVIRKILERFVNTSYKSAKKIIFISKPAYDSDIKRNKELKSKSALLTNAIDPDDFKIKTKRNWKEIRFLFLGRLEEIKGIKYLLQAFKKISDNVKDTKLYVAGEGSLKKYILDFIKKNDLKKRIKFLGWIEDTAKILSETDVFVLPSWEKGQPIALLEAMASGKIIITSLNYIEDGKTGIRIKPKNTQDLYEKMMQVCNDLKKHNNLGKNAKMEIKEKMSWDTVIKKYIREYNSVIQS